MLIIVFPNVTSRVQIWHWKHALLGEIYIMLHKRAKETTANVMCICYGYHRRQDYTSWYNTYTGHAENVALAICVWSVA